MGDAFRSVVMSQSCHMGSARKDNAEGVAKRRAAIQQEIEQRQKLARKLQDEKMARAVAQKEGRLLKQREAQQREMLRAKAVLDRRTQILAEKEEKKEAMLTKVHVLASCLSSQHKERPLYAFGSSTPRELEYLTQLTREQKIYDRRLMHSGRIRTAPSGSSSHSTLTPPYDSRCGIGTSMTGSLYVVSSELKKNHKCTPNFMTQSMMATPKPSKTKEINRKSGNRQSSVQRPLTATKTGSSIVTDIPIRAKKLVQHREPTLHGPGHRTVQSKPDVKKIEALKKEHKSKEVRKSTGIKANGEIKVEVMLEKSSADQMNETPVILEENNIIVRDDITTVEGSNITPVKEVVNPVPDIEELKKLSGKCVAVEVSGNKENVKPTNYASQIVGSNMLDGDMNDENEVAFATKATAVEDASLLDISSGQENNFINEAEKNTAVVGSVAVDHETGMHMKQERVNDVLKEAQMGEVHDDPVTVNLDSSQTEFVEDQGNVDEGEAFVLKESSTSVAERHSEQEKAIIQKPHEIAEDKKENDVSATEMGENPAKEKIQSDSLIENNIALNAVKIETVAEDLKLTEEKNSVEEKRRIQDEFLEKEQRDREIRKAKLASIMSRTRSVAPSVSVVSGSPSVSVVSGAPSVSVISSTLSSETSESETQKHRTGVPLASEHTPVKNVLSHTTASVLQKLATTNPKLLSVLQRNGSNRSLADELSAADPSMSITLPGQSSDSIASHEGSPSVHHLHFEPDVNHRPVAMK